MSSPYDILKKSSRKIPYKEAVLLVLWFAEYYDITVKIGKIKARGVPKGTAGYTDYDSSVNCKTCSIFLEKKAPYILQHFFHELGHIHCVRNGLWRKYHNMKPVNKMSKKELRDYIRTTLRAEKWVSEWGDKEMRKWFPYLPAVLPYHEKGAKEWVHKEYLKDIKKRLNR